jgi:hypothetical protein
LQPQALVSTTGDSNNTSLNAQLKVLAGMSDVVVSAREKIQIDVPLNAFSIRPAEFAVKLRAQLADGKSLPEWLKFEARLGRFEVSAPEFLNHDVALQLLASSEDGQHAVLDFKLKMRGQQDEGNPQLPGRQGLSEKLKMAAGEKVSNHRNNARVSL